MTTPTDPTSAMGYDGSTITVNSFVRHRGDGNHGDVWRVTRIRDSDGRYALSLVNATDPNRFTSFWADLAVTAPSATEGPR